MGFEPNRPGQPGSGSASALGERPLSVNALFDILANLHRRALLAFLRDQPDGTTSFDAAAEQIVAAVERDRDVHSDPRDVRVELHHSHLPKLADAGVVEYDVRSETIRYRPDARLEALFDQIAALRQE